MAKKSKLKKVSLSPTKEHHLGIIKLLLADHRLLRKLMAQVKSSRSTPAKQMKAFKELEKSVSSHVKAEENTFFTLIRNHPKFKDATMEGYEEHRVHENVIRGLKKVSDKDRRLEQMKIYCEFLEHHLDEEEENLFPRFKKYAALQTKRKISKNYVKVRKKTSSDKRGAARYSD